jgi:C-terminal processing protease CtpA/Prc
VRSTTAIKSFAGGLFGLLLIVSTSAAATEAAVDRLIESVQRYHPHIADARGGIKTTCGGDARCAAEHLAAALGARARIEAVKHPTTDEIRRVDSQPSVATVKTTAPGTLRLTLMRFGRKADWEIIEAIGQAGPLDMVELDLRGNSGGDLDRMRRVAGIFTGERKAAFALVSHDVRMPIDIPAHPSGIETPQMRVLVSRNTASSAEILAALLRINAGAEIRGEKTHGKDYLLRILPVDHDTRLLFPAERVEIPGEDIKAGVTPDGPIGQPGQ